MPSDAPIAIREFENRDGAVVLEIYAPSPRDGRGFNCRFVIRWANGKTKDRTASGIDSMQALLQAISAAWVTMLYPKIGERDDSLTFLGKPDLGIGLISMDPLP